VDNHRFKLFLIFLVILTLTGISFLPALFNDFVNWDDYVHLLDNQTVQSLNFENIKEIFRFPINTIYIPLTLLSFSIEHHFFGLNPFPYHLNNYILHLIVTGLVFLFFNRLGLTFLGAAFGSLLFGIHPMNAESVAWVTERKDLLFAFFYMLALLAYLKHIRIVQDKERPWFIRRKYIFLATFWGILSMLAKPMALSLPLIFLLLDWYKAREFKADVLKEKAPLFLIIILLASVTYHHHMRIAGESLTEGTLIWTWSIIFYLRQFLFPFFGVPIYRLPQPVTLINPEYLLSFIVFILILVTLIRFRHHRVYLFSFAFYFLSIFFLMRFDSSDVSVVAERFMYLSKCGFCFLFGWFCQKTADRIKTESIYLNRIVFISVIFMMVTFSMRSFNQCKVWYNSKSLWQHQLKYFPNEYLALNNLVSAYIHEESDVPSKRLARLISKKGITKRWVDDNRDLIFKSRVNYLIFLLKKAIIINPEYFGTHFNLAKIYKATGLWSKAVYHFEKAKTLDPEFSEIYPDLGDLYLSQDKILQALPNYYQAIFMRPDDENVYIRVIQSFSQAIGNSKNPSLIEEARSKVFQCYKSFTAEPWGAVLYRKANYYSQEDDLIQAAEFYRKAVEANPQYIAALQNLN